MIEFEVKSKTQPIGKRKGQTMYYAQPVSQQHLTNKMVVDRIVRDALELGQSVNLADLGSFRIVVPAKMMDTEAEVTAESLPPPKDNIHAQSCHA